MKVIGGARVGVAATVATLLLPAAAFALDVPPLEGRVNDRAGLLSFDKRARLEQKLAAYEASSGHQFAVLTLPSLDNEALEPFSFRVVEQWKLGKKGKDDGLLLLVAARSHGIRIEVGYGLEAAITDALSARVIREVIAPAFRAGDYPGGIERGLDRLMAAAGGTGGAADEPQPGSGAKRPWSKWHRAMLLLALMFLGPIVALLLLAAILMALHRGGRSRVRLSGPAVSSVGGPTLGGGSSGGGSSSDGSSSDGFSGGGGGFGGGGASGSW